MLCNHRGWRALRNDGSPFCRSGINPCGTSSFSFLCELVCEQYGASQDPTHSTGPDDSPETLEYGLLVAPFEIELAESGKCGEIRFSPLDLGELVKCRGDNWCGVCTNYLQVWEAVGQGICQLLVLPPNEATTIGSQLGAYILAPLGEECLEVGGVLGLNSLNKRIAEATAS